MGLTLRQMAEDRASASFEYMGETVHFTYMPGHYTPEMEAKIREQSEEDTSFLIETITTIVVDWDVQNDDGTMYPIDAEHVEALPAKFLLHVMSAVWQDMIPGEGRTSGGGSRRKGR